MKKPSIIAGLPGVNVCMFVLTILLSTMAQATVVEFYNANLDNYFVTADADEAAAIGRGSAGPGWIRTGNTFNSGGSTFVCRFYGSTLGPNSHFYTANPKECAYLKSIYNPTAKSWKYESNDFLTTYPDPNKSSQDCPAKTVPVYRAYNKGFERGIDSNHRITTSSSALGEVINRGWSYEGVVMCAPETSPPPPTPSSSIDLTKLKPGNNKIELGWTDLPSCSKVEMEEARGQVWVCHDGGQNCWDTWLFRRVCIPNAPSCGWEIGNLGFQVPITYIADQKAYAYADVTIPQIPASLDDLKANVNKIIDNNIKDALSNHVNATVGHFKNNLNNCTIAAATGTVVSAIITVGSAALPTFMGIFSPCVDTSFTAFTDELFDLPSVLQNTISNTTNDLQNYFKNMASGGVKVYTESQCTNWRRM